MFSDYKKKYPQINEILNKTKMIRRDEILENLRVNDDIYNDILFKRKEQSMKLSSKLSPIVFIEYEQYMDFVYEQTNYELNVIYESAFYDAIELLERLNMLSKIT